MAQFPLSNLLDGTKSLATKIYNATGELFTSSNPGHVQLSGRNTEEVILVNATAIRDINSINIDLSPYLPKYKDFDLFIQSSLDKDVRLQIAKGDCFYVTDSGSMVYGNIHYDVQTHYRVKTTGSTLLFLSQLKPYSSDNPVFSGANISPWKNAKGTGFFLALKAVDVPTTGSISITMMGVIN